MSPTVLCLQCLSVFALLGTAALHSEESRLLVLFLDGLRWDYITRKDLPGFARLKQLGSHVERIQPVFPADCYPNIYSLFTGLYPSSHGVVGNRVYDIQQQMEFDHTDSSSRDQAHMWVDAEPLWITAKKQGKRVFTYHLPICETNLLEASPDHCVPYNERQMNAQGFQESIDEALRVLIMGATNVAVVYNDRLDALSHEFGPESLTLEEELLPQLDRTITQILDTLEERKESIHLMVLSDHGMSQIAENRIVYLERIIMRSEMHHLVNHGGTVAIWPKEDYFEDTLSRLQNSGEPIEVYKKEEVPAHWQVKEHRLIPPILVVANPGYFLLSMEMRYPWYKLRTPITGWHGYSPDERDMHSPFFLVGPGVRPGVQMETLPIVDLYQVICHVIGVSPVPHNGTWSKVSPMLKGYPQEPGHVIYQVTPRTTYLKNAALRTSHTSNSLLSSIIALFGLLLEFRFSFYRVFV